MLTELAEHPHLFWLSLGGLLLVVETLGTAGYLLWCGVAAVLVGGLIWLFPAMSWEWQGSIFALLTVLVTYFWWQWLRRSEKRKGQRSLLNHRDRQLIGQRGVISESLHHGQGRMQLGDTTWRVRAEEDLALGTQVEVIAVEGITLLVRKLP